MYSAGSLLSFSLSRCSPGGKLILSLQPTHTLHTRLKRKEKRKRREKKRLLLVPFFMLLPPASRLLMLCAPARPTTAAAAADFSFSPPSLPPSFLSFFQIFLLLCLVPTQRRHPCSTTLFAAYVGRSLFFLPNYTAVAQ